MRQWRWRTTPFAPVWQPWKSRPESAKLAAEINSRDGIDLQLRIGLNSGQVIVGEIGSNTASYTAIGEHVGMAQHMESVAPPGGVMLSEPTARLVEYTVVLGEPEVVHIKGARTRRCAQGGCWASASTSPAAATSRPWSGAMGNSVSLARSSNEVIGGTGCVVNMMGPAGIGKSRLVRETAAMAASRGIPIFTAYCSPTFAMFNSMSWRDCCAPYSESAI